MQAMLPPSCNNSAGVQNRYCYAGENARRESENKSEKGVDYPG
jgi:hypothetical protein